MRSELRTLAIGGLVLMAGCSGEEMLPGRARPLLKHDWPHPRDYRFGPSEFKAPDPAGARVETPSGLRAFVLPSDAEPVVRVSAALPLGRLRERAGEAGASGLLIEILTRRGPADPARPLSLRLESLGSKLSVEEDLDLTRISLEVLDEDWREGLGLLVDLLRRPDLEEGFIRGYRTGPGYSEPTSGLAASGFRPRVELERLLLGYPLAPADGGLTVNGKAVRDLASRSLGVNRVVLGIGGNVPRAEVEAALIDLSRGWPAAQEEAALAKVPEGAPQPGPLHTRDAPALVGWIAMGRTIGPVPESDRAPLAVMANVFNTRLNIAIREMRGLANRALLTIPHTASGAGLVSIATGGRPESVAPLIKFSLEEAVRIAGPDSITPEELERAKGALILGIWQASLDGVREASTTFALETVRHGGVERLLQWPEAVQAVSAEQVKDAAQKYLKPEEMTKVILGPLEKIRRARHPRWPVGLDELSPEKTS